MRNTKADAQIMVERLLKESFENEMIAIAKELPLQHGEFYMYQSTCVGVSNQLFKRVNTPKGYDSTLKMYVDLVALQSRCNHLLRKMYIYFVKPSDFIQALPLGDQKFSCVQAENTYKEFREDPLYKELEVRLLTARVLQ